MAGQQTDDPWPGTDERQTVAEMIANPHSEHWSACRTFIENFVHKNCPDLQSMKDDLIHETMISIMRGLPSFRFDSKLRTWIFSIIKNRANDLRRKNRKMALMEVSIEASDDEANERIETFHPHDSHTPEEKHLIVERLEEVKAELEKFAAHYNKSERNGIILRKYFIEEYNAEEIALELGMNPPAVNAVIRSARLHLRLWLKEQRP